MATSKNIFDGLGGKLQTLLGGCWGIANISWTVGDSEANKVCPCPRKLRVLKESYDKHTDASQI